MKRFRGLNYNPCYSASDDAGQTWSAPEFLMKIGEGRVRPYVKYLCNGNDRIDFLYTEAHPRNQNTSIYQLRPYYVATSNGKSMLLWLEGSYSAYTDYNTHVRWLYEDQSSER